MSLRKMAAAMDMESSYQHYEDRLKKEYLPPEMAQKAIKILVASGLAEDECSVLLPSDRRHIQPHDSELKQVALKSPQMGGGVPHTSEMPLDVPIRGTAAGALTGAFQMDESTIIGYGRRPPGLMGNPDAYALEVEGDSMEPRYPHGEMIYVDPHRKISPGDYVVIVTKNHRAGTPQTWVKQLKRRTEKKVIVEQFNPPTTIDFDAKNILSIHKIPTFKELMGR